MFVHNAFTQNLRWHFHTNRSCNNLGGGGGGYGLKEGVWTTPDGHNKAGRDASTADIATPRLPELGAYVHLPGPLWVRNGINIPSRPLTWVIV